MRLSGNARTKTLVIARNPLAKMAAASLDLPPQSRGKNSKGEIVMNLSAPTLPVFLVSVVLAIVALLVHYAGVSIPWASKHSFEVLLIGYAALLAGNLFKGI